MFDTARISPSGADVIVVGGGLAGLAATALVARAGRAVVVLEQGKGLGGRAATRVREGIHFNLGPHALYRNGRAFQLLRELGVSFSGRVPNPGRALLLDSDSAHTLPTGPGALIASRLFGAREKWRLVRLLGCLGRIDARSIDRVPLRDWIDQVAGTGKLAGLLRTLVRVSTYADDPARLSAGAALDQLRTALSGNVWYLDGGWQTLIDGLRDRAAAHGAWFRTAARVESVRSESDGVSVELAGGEVLRAGAAILAVGPDEAGSLLDLPADAPLVRWSANRLVVRAACLDLALDRLPRPGHRAAFGLDLPLYFSVHSASARLGPEGVAVVHAMKNLRSGLIAPPEQTERELEILLDRVQPGWRSHVIARRFLPAMTVAHALPLADQTGLAGRPVVAVPGTPGVFLAGDWVGPDAMLADASAASAEEAARLALQAIAHAPARDDRSHSHAYR